jgi:hypothetical protein
MIIKTKSIYKSNYNAKRVKKDQVVQLKVGGSASALSGVAELI